MRVPFLVCALLAWSLDTAIAQDITPAPLPAAPHPARVTGTTDVTTGKCKGDTNIASDSFEGDFKTKEGIYRGNVIVTQANCRLRADKIVAEAVSGSKDINRLTATGNVVFDSTSGTATGDNGVYELGPKTITFTGKVVLTKGKNVMRGTLLVVDLNSGLARLTAKGLPGGRVQSTLVPEHNQSPPKTRDGGTN
ncbi:MAG TPA: LptA/OstA family protein [Rhizomicrobium sp.]|nr:LptA/OstA family protein [Rhizomicrobium sp.]